MTHRTLRAIRAAVRAANRIPTTQHAIALRATIAATYMDLSEYQQGLPPDQAARCAQDLLDAARAHGGYTYGPVPAADRRWDNDATGFARQENEHAPPDDVAAAMAALAHLDHR